MNSQADFFYMRLPVKHVINVNSQVFVRGDLLDDLTIHGDGSMVSNWPRVKHHFLGPHIYAYVVLIAPVNKCVNSGTVATNARVTSEQTKDNCIIREFNNILTWLGANTVICKWSEPCEVPVFLITTSENTELNLTCCDLLDR